MSMHIVPRTNWTTALAELLDAAAPGDTIVCWSEPVRKMAERAHQRVYADKELHFVVDAGQQPDEPVLES